MGKKDTWIEFDHFCSDQGIKIPSKRVSLKSTRMEISNRVTETSVIDLSYPRNPPFGTIWPFLVVCSRISKIWNDEKKSPRNRKNLSDEHEEIHFNVFIGHFVQFFESQKLSVERDICLQVDSAIFFANKSTHSTDTQLTLRRGWRREFGHLRKPRIDDLNDVFELKNFS